MPIFVLKKYKKKKTNVNNLVYICICITFATVCAEYCARWNPANAYTLYIIYRARKKPTYRNKKQNKSFFNQFIH